MDWRLTEKQKKVLEPLNKIKEEYGRKMAEIILGLPPKYQGIAYYEARNVGYQLVTKIVDLEFKLKIGLGKGK